jgi:hypothetical protein
MQSGGDMEIKMIPNSEMVKAAIKLLSCYYLLRNTMI